MGSLSIWHWIIVLVVVLLVFGTKRLRGAGSDLGEAVKGFKKAMDDPKHLELIEQLNQDLWYRSGEDYAKWAVETFARDKALIERLGLAAK